MKKVMVVERIEWVTGSTYVYYDLIDRDQNNTSLGKGSFHEEKMVQIQEIEAFIKNAVKPEDGETIEIECGK